MNDSHILALGGDGKPCFAYLDDRNVKTGKAHGDLNTVNDFEDFSKDIETIIAKKKINIVATDLHPGYATTALSASIAEKNKQIKLVGVSHHYAHIVSCMYDNSIKGQVIGVAFDGTGYGPDGNMWGGEFITADYQGFKREAHLKYVYQPGADAAAREIWRMGLSYLYSAYCGQLKDIRIPFIKKIDAAKSKVIVSMMDKKINCPLTSSAGRLFDAAAAITCVKLNSEKEADAAVMFEKKCASRVSEYYDFNVADGVVDTSPVIKGIVRDINKKTRISVVAAKFHNTLGEIIFDVTKKISKKTGMDRVAISGGCFQNRYLTDYITRKFDGSDMILFKHKNVPASDAGISVGQLWAVKNGYRGA